LSDSDEDESVSGRERSVVGSIADVGDEFTREDEDIERFPDDDEDMEDPGYFVCGGFCTLLIDICNIEKNCELVISPINDEEADVVTSATLLGKTMHVIGESSARLLVVVERMKRPEGLSDMKQIIDSLSKKPIAKWTSKDGARCGLITMSARVIEEAIERGATQFLCNVCKSCVDARLRWKDAGQGGGARVIKIGDYATLEAEVDIFRLDTDSDSDAISVEFVCARVSKVGSRVLFDDDETLDDCIMFHGKLRKCASFGEGGGGAASVSVKHSLSLCFVAPGDYAIVVCVKVRNQNWVSESDLVVSCSV
jgi:hypothetical protein